MPGCLKFLAETVSFGKIGAGWTQQGSITRGLNDCWAEVGWVGNREGVHVVSIGTDGRRNDGAECAQGSVWSFVDGGSVVFGGGAGLGSGRAGGIASGQFEDAPGN